MYDNNPHSHFPTIQISVNTPRTDRLVRQVADMRPRSCEDLLKVSTSLPSEVYELYKDSGESYFSYCKMVRFHFKMSELIVYFEF